MFWFIVIAIIIIIVVVNKNNKKTVPRAPLSPPPPLDRIRYVHVDYVSWPKMEKWSTDYSGTVSWSAYRNCWEIFIDSSSFAKVMNEKKSIVFLDENKNRISMQGYSISTEDVVEGDCGVVKIYKTA